MYSNRTRNICESDIVKFSAFMYLSVESKTNNLIVYFEIQIIQYQFGIR